MSENRLMTPQLCEAVKPFPLYSQDGKAKEAFCVAVFTLGRVRWYVLEGSTEGDDLTMFGIVIGLFEDEYGYFTAGQLSEVEIEVEQLRDIKVHIEKVENWSPKPLHEIDDRQLHDFLSRIHDYDDEPVYELTEESCEDGEIS